jgi:hypothetical protein
MTVCVCCFLHKESAEIRDPAHTVKVKAVVFV